MSDGKVCILSSAHPAMDSRIFHKEALSLARAGYQVVLVAQHPKSVEVEGIRIVGLRRPRSRLWRIALLWLPFLLALQQRAAIYHFHDPELIPAMILLKWITRRSVIYDVHEDVPKHMLSKKWLPGFSRIPLSRIFTAIERVGARFFDAVIAAGEDVFDHFHISSKLTVVANYPPIRLTENMRAHRQGGKETAVAIYVGELAAFRCVEEMILAANLLSDEVKLVLAGAFHESRYRDTMRRMAGRNVEFTGLLPHEAALSLLQGADIGLACFYPDPNTLLAVSRNRKLYEYMAAGLPVIVSHFPAWKDFVDSVGCGLAVDPFNPREIALAVRYLIHHPMEAARMGQNGRAAVREKFNWESEARKLLAVYERVRR